MNVAGNLVKAIDALNSNAWAFSALCIGVFLSVHKMPIGDQIVMGSFALLKSGSGDSGKSADTDSKGVS